MKVEVVSLGELLVEIMRKELDKPLYSSADFVGPFPSGAPAIFIARFANAVGAMATTKKGPMEGAPTMEEVLEFMPR